MSLSNRSGVLLLLPSTARSSDLTGTHQVADVLLQKFVVAVKLVVLLSNCFDAVENSQKRVL
jgi:hypothetical protein